ncbi:fibronectin type III domain-containing protein [Treponema primitia]|uniref:hypothetical protein n=1 Tax=Treponema primitia TaxID=88058 RepID=UPI0039809983
MKILRSIIPVILLFGLGSCDLFLAKDHRNVYDDVAYEVWLAKQPVLSVRMELIPGSGAANPPAGLITLPDNRPKLEVPFNVAFSVNPGFGFVEWRAYRADTDPKNGDTKLGPEVEFKSLNASGTEAEVRIIINEGVTIIPFCAALPEVADHNLPNAAFPRLPTNYPVEIRFNAPVDSGSFSFRNSANPEGTIAITGKPDQGMGQSRDLTELYILEKDEWGIRLLPAALDGLGFANHDITIELSTGIRSKDYPLYMAESRTFSYGTSDGPNKDLPVLSFIRGALGTGAADVFFSDNTVNYNNATQTWPDGYALKSNAAGQRTVYLFFDAYKNMGAIKEIAITEERIMDITGQIVPVETQPPRVYPNDNLRDASSPLALVYTGEVQKIPFVIPHTVQTAKEGVLRFYIQPKDSYGMGYGLNAAREGNLYVDAVLDLPPAPVSGVGGVYNRSAGDITLTWTDPANADLDHIAINWIGPSSSGSTALAGAKSKSLTIGAGSYTFTLTAVDRGGNSGETVTFPFTADADTPSPVTGLTYSRDLGTISWTNPSETGTDKIKINWTGSGTGDVLISLVTPGGTQTYRIDNLAAPDGAVYTVTVKTANDSKESDGVSVTVYPDAIAPAAPDYFTASYNQAAKTILVGWPDPGGDVQDIKLEWGIAGTSITGTKRVGKEQQPCVITAVDGIVSDSRGYTIKAYAIDRAGNTSLPSEKTVSDTTPPTVAAVNGVGYTTLKAAFDAVPNGTGSANPVDITVLKSATGADIGGPITVKGYVRLVAAEFGNTKLTFTAAGGSPIVVPAGAGLTLGDGSHDIILDGGAPSVSRTGALVQVKGAFTINGSSRVQNNNATTGSGGGVSVIGGTLRIDAGSIESNRATRGGGVYLEGTNAKLIVTAFGSINNNTASVDGGGVYGTGGLITLQNDSLISDNSTESGDGGGVYLVGTAAGNKPSLSIETGGKIQRNTAIENGGGVYVGPYANLKMTGNSLIGSLPSDDRTNVNNAASGGGLYLAENGTASLDGTAMIHINLINGNRNSIALAGTLILRNGAFFEDACLLGNTGTIEVGSAKLTPSNYYMMRITLEDWGTTRTAPVLTGFVANNNTKFEVYGPAGTNYMLKRNGYLIDAKYTRYRDERVEDYYDTLQDVFSDTDFPAGGSVNSPDLILMHGTSQSVGADTGYTIPSNVHVSLKKNTGNFTFTRTAASNIPMFTVANGASLTIGTVSYALFLDGGGTSLLHSSPLVKVDGGSFMMGTNATLQNNNNSGDGGAVYVSSGTFIMNGGTISSNTASGNGGGVYWEEDSSFTWNNSGVISSNTPNNVYPTGWLGNHPPD